MSDWVSDAGGIFFGDEKLPLVILSTKQKIYIHMIEVLDTLIHHKCQIQCTTCIQAGHICNISSDLFIHI